VDTRQKARQLTPNLDSARSALIQRQKDQAVAQLARGRPKGRRPGPVRHRTGWKECRGCPFERETARGRPRAAQSTLARMQKSFDEGAVAAQDLDSAKAKRDVSEEALKQAADQQAVAELICNRRSGIRRCPS